nr:MAG TPA: Repressor protein CI [Caudoviricetes sp.]
MKMQNLRYLRDAKNITQSKLAGMLSVARTTVTMWETGDHEPGLKTMQKVADMFDVPVEFLGGTGIFENWDTIVDHFAEIYDAISSDIPADLYMHNFSGEITLKSWLLKIMVYGKQDLAIINWFKFAIASVDFEAGDDGGTATHVVYTKQFASIIKMHTSKYFDSETARIVSYGDAMRSFLDAHAPGDAIRIPVLGYVAAGIPIEAIEDIVGWEDISKVRYGSGEYFGLQVQGHSMEPKISDGDVVIVRRQPDVDSGDIAVVLVNGDDATVKKVKKSPQGVTLIPSNPAYEPMYYTNAEIESLPVQILGRVVELRAKF